jgi:hypothetical protein
MDFSTTLPRLMGPAHPKYNMVETGFSWLRLRTAPISVQSTERGISPSEIKQTDPKNGDLSNINGDLTCKP